MIEDNDLAIGVRNRLESSYLAHRTLLWILAILLPIGLFFAGRQLDLDFGWFNNKAVNIEDLPFIRSNNNDFKILPEESGGLEIKNIDRDVYRDIVGNNNTSNYLNTSNNEQRRLDAKIDEIIKQDIFGDDKNLKTQTVNSPLKRPTAPAITAVNTAPVPAKPNTNTKNDVNLNKSLVNNIRDKNKQHKPTMISAQIAAFSTLEKTNSYKNYLLERFPEIFKNNALYISRDEDSNGKTIYRLRLLNFATRDAAKAFCNSYLQATAKLGGNCLVLEE